ncbi:hypothetical protein [Actinomyces trachealis]|uniref:hypothetical protein n=1 Tax=Actinomyces trachealis TaxID=2763540 RepID=UPI001892A926|nr:hypothetical protein [Actinomyces trachealis]
MLAGRLVAAVLAAVAVGDPARRAAFDGAHRFYESQSFTNTEPGGEERMLCYLMELGD